MQNKYAGKCEHCSCEVAARQGTLERNGRRWTLLCGPCFDKSDNSSYEDRECGNRAYEDQCAERCGF